ncbi:MAG: glycerol-3-phosphate 1-O-acyltransferase PlsB [Thalassotalea sp.]
MLAFRSLFYLLLKLPLKLLVRCRVITAEQVTATNNNKQPIFYIIRTQSASDILALQKACKEQNFPNPLEDVVIDGKSFRRILCLEKPTPLFHWREKGITQVLTEGAELLSLHNNDDALDIKLVPVNLNWGRKPTKEKNSTTIGSVFSEQQSPTWLRKFFIVLFFGRHTLVRFSNAFSFRSLVNKHGSDMQTARKLLRVTRFHFHRQTIAATGPRLMHRQQMFKVLLSTPAIKKLIADEARNKKCSEEQIKKDALKIMDEIAGDYSDAIVRLGERVLSWLWNRLYNGITVKNSERLRKLAEDGQEIIYVPCHRSHMDYLLLTYVIYQQGLVIPRIAAGINLNFWPAGPIFRKSGAFFIRRSFRGNRLYSTIFREYLGLLFERGYSVKYYTEGGRSRTGRLLPPKTGMLAMTIQSLLRGVDRPLTLVPVYIGYEHVMEVGTYHKELSGSKKKNESIFGVFKAIKNLRNYGKGFVNFGTPISINDFLNKQVPDWQDAIDPIEPQKPSWLTPSVNQLSHQVMIGINKAVALNGVSLIALILHASENKALSKKALVRQLDFFINIQVNAPYSKELTLPEGDGESLLADAIALNKVTICEDSLGTVVSLSESAALEMSYYRNNILHAFLLPALVCRLLEHSAKIAHDDLIARVGQLIEIIKPEFFLWQDKNDVKKQTIKLLSVFENDDIAKQSKAGFWSLTDETQSLALVRTMSECAEASVQRIVIVSQLLQQSAPISKANLEANMVAMAKRLSILNNIHAPEFIDKKAQSSLVNHMKSLNYIEVNEDKLFIVNEQLSALDDIVCKLVNIEVLQTLAVESNE